MLQELDELLKHHGVKGMKWGQHHGGHGSETPFKERSKIGKHLDSMKRERSWGKHLKNVDNMSTKDVRELTTRIKAENSLKALSKSKVATKKDKQDYLRRHEMSTQELNRKIARLNAKEELHKAVKNASKEQREAAIKVGQTAATIAVKKATGQKLTPKDFMDAVSNPTIKTKQDAFSQGIDIAAGKATHPKVKKALKVAKGVKIGNAKS